MSLSAPNSKEATWVSGVCQSSLKAYRLPEDVTFVGKSTPKTNGSNQPHVSCCYMLRPCPNARTNASCSAPGYPGNPCGAGPAKVQNRAWTVPGFCLYQYFYDYWHTMLCHIRFIRLCTIADIFGSLH